MSNIGKTLLLLCKQIDLCTNISITPDDLNLIKCNNVTVEIVDNFWTVLNILSHHAAQKMNSAIDFQYYDKIVATKLYFGYLNYSDIEFFSLSHNNCEDARLLLIALAWLIARHNIFNVIIKIKIADGIFGNEFINKYNNSINEHDDKEKTQISLELNDEINVIIKKCMKVNYSLKNIAELMDQKIRLITKIHNNTSNICNLPYLNVSEVILMKNYCTNNQKHSELDLITIKKLNYAANIIYYYVKWTKRDQVFFSWMTEIVEECKTNKIRINNDELSRLTSTMRHITKNKINSFKKNKNINDIYKNPVVSRFFKLDAKNSDAEIWNELIIQEFKEASTELSTKIKQTNSEIQNIMKSIPNYVQI